MSEKNPEPITGLRIQKNIRNEKTKGILIDLLNSFEIEAQTEEIVGLGIVNNADEKRFKRDKYST